MKHFLILIIVLVDFHLMAAIDHFTFSAYVTGVSFDNLDLHGRGYLLSL